MRMAVIDDERPARSELIYLLNKIIPEAEITEISNGEDALNVINKKYFNLFLIDINLGDISGITLASTIRRISPDSEIVFATAYNNYAEDAFRVEALDYLLKPFSEQKVKDMIERYNQKYEKRLNKDIQRISIKAKGKIVFIDINSIVYIESQNKNCCIYTKSSKYMDNTPLKDFEYKLKSKGFFRIQRGYLINTKYIKEIHSWFNNSNCVRMKYFDKITLPVSRNKIEELKNFLKV